MMNQPLFFLVAMVFGFGAIATPFRVALPAVPSSAFYPVAYDDMSEAISALVLEPLIRLNPKTGLPEAALAETFSASKNFKNFSFKLNAKARFSDGQAVTADDVLFTYEALKNPKNQTLGLGSLFQVFTCVKKSPSEVVFSTTQPTVLGLLLFAEFNVLPAHALKDIPLAEIKDSFLGSGPYRISGGHFPQTLKLIKNPDYWAKNLFPDRYLLPEIEFVSHSDQTLLHEAFKRGEIDYFYFLSSQLWQNATASPEYTSGKLIKLKMENQLEFGLSGFSFNLRRPLFKSLKVRQALAHLLPRDKLIREVFFDQYLPGTGVAHPRSTYHHPKNFPLAYSVEKARALLDSEGWSLTQEGVRKKNGEPLAFELLVANAGVLRYTNIYQEALRQEGISLNVKVLDWPGVQKRKAAGEFDLVETYYNRSAHFPNLRHQFHSSFQNQPSVNLTGFAAPQVDALIEKLEGTPISPQRTALVQKIDKLVAENLPILFTWEPYFTRIAYSNRVVPSSPAYEAFSVWKTAFSYGWRLKEEPVL